MKRPLIILFVLTFLTGSCRHKASTSAETEKEVVIAKMDGQTEAIEDSIKKANALSLQAQFKRVVYPKAQTQPVDQQHDIDAADDPAIWYNAENPGESRVLGTDKQAGLALYNLKGELVDFQSVGRVNNVDLRYNFPHNDQKIAIAAASERNLNALMLFSVTADSLSIVHTKPALLDSFIIDDAYGCCMYYSRKKDTFYAFIGGKNGNIQQWKLESDAGKISIEAVRTISLASQSEGMVADDETGILYIAEEGNAIWKTDAEEDGSNELTKLADSDSLNTHIAYDLEGLDIYYAGDGKGYLIASVQGNFSYAVFEKHGNNKYLGNFIIRANNSIDGAEETDGLAVSNLNMGPDFPNGLLVVQDGFNEENNQPRPQNFKLIDWADVSKSFNDPLIISPDYKWWK